MKRIRDILGNSRGLSLFEILVALIITGVVTLAIMKTYITQHRHYIAQEDVTNIQQNARAAIDELGKCIRMAGHGLPLGLDPIAASNTNPDTITITFQIGDCDTYLAAPMGSPSAQLECASDVSCFYNGQWAYIFEPDSGGGEWFEISEVQPTSLNIQHTTMALSRSYGADAIVMAMNEIKFFVDTTDVNHPYMMLKTPAHPPQLYAENIEDLQFRYRMKNGMIVDQPSLADDVREVLISVTGRSNVPDPEEHYNPYRRRTFATSVFLRNVGI